MSKKPLSRSNAACCAAAVMAATFGGFTGSVSHAQAPLFRVNPPLLHADPPLPPPCAADGVCRPKRDTYGHYPTRWRRWATDTSDRPGNADDQGRQLDPRPEISAEEEDREAPPPSEKIESPESGFEDEDDAPLPPLPRVLDRAPPADADSGENLPPLPPFPTRPPGASNRPAASGQAGPLTLGEGDAFRQQPLEDTPPALPAGLRLTSVRNAWATDTPRPAAVAGNQLAFDSAPSTGQRYDRAVRTASVRDLSPNASPEIARRAFYESDSPPPFPASAFR